MTDQNKPFICYKSKWGMKIKPRTLSGWIAFGWWMVAMAVLSGGFIWLLQGTARDALILGYATLYAMAMVIWGAAMARWMYLRSEVIDVDALAKQRNARRGR